MNRQLFPIMMLVLVGCVVAWYLAVNPRLEQAKALEDEIDEIAQIIAEDGKDVQALRTQVGLIEARIEEVKRKNSFAEDSANIYMTVKKLTRAHKLAVEGWMYKATTALEMLAVKKKRSR